MRAVLHIGTEKTGTQSIQECLLRNREKLQENGYCAIQIGGRINSRAVTAYCLNPGKQDDFFRQHNLNTPEKQKQFRQDFLREFQAQMTSLPQGTHTVIFSSEHFHSRLRTADEVKRVRELLVPFFDEFTIICYLREQAACCTSSHSTTIKSGQIISMDEFFKNCVPSNHYYNYNTLLTLWENVFGEGVLEVSLFSPDLFLNRSLLDDFISKICPDLISTLNTALPPKNRSLSRGGQIVSRALSRLFPKNKTGSGENPFRKICQRAISRKLSGHAPQPPLELRQQIYDAFKESNEQVRKKFFPDRAVLFPPPASGK